MSLNFAICLRNFGIAKFRNHPIISLDLLGRKLQTSLTQVLYYKNVHLSLLVKGQSHAIGGRPFHGFIIRVDIGYFFHFDVVLVLKIYKMYALPIFHSNFGVSIEEYFPENKIL
jgi:hypothetical protein